ncbi:hypothetical protein [Enhygromyxa salina]|uniref:Uncharacterized protein n=1 Tax=Enhygromyxa salina TaxID=215803 RepID=A0A2S9XQ07_9BACT|nr:hypothetical protein [Enhygromyxa salina]PRP94830.1 hypothetical protein ENSA7_76530 [Enhygromyxa salina]
MSNTATHFTLAGMVAALLGLVAGALLWHGPNSGLATALACGCLLVAAITRLRARRGLRAELVREAKRDDFDDPEAYADASLDEWARR